MKDRKPKQKEQRATALTDLCRLIICGVGGSLIAFSVTGYLDDERPWPLAVAVICGALGLVLIGLGIFAKPKTVESI